LAEERRQRADIRARRRRNASPTTRRDAAGRPRQSCTHAGCAICATGDTDRWRERNPSAINAFDHRNDKPPAAVKPSAPRLYTRETQPAQPP
jgi:hypothetical protein